MFRSIITILKSHRMKSKPSFLLFYFGERNCQTWKRDSMTLRVTGLTLILIFLLQRFGAASQQEKHTVPYPYLATNDEANIVIYSYLLYIFIHRQYFLYNATHNDCLKYLFSRFYLRVKQRHH